MRNPPSARAAPFPEIEDPAPSLPLLLASLARYRSMGPPWYQTQVLVGQRKRIRFAQQLNGPLLTVGPPTARRADRPAPNQPYPPCRSLRSLPPCTRHNPIKSIGVLIIQGGHRASIGAHALDSPGVTRLLSIHTPLWIVSLPPLPCMAFVCGPIHGLDGRSASLCSGHQGGTLPPRVPRRCSPLRPSDSPPPPRSRMPRPLGGPRVPRHRLSSHRTLALCGFTEKTCS